MACLIDDSLQRRTWEHFAGVSSAWKFEAIYLYIILKDYTNNFPSPSSVGITLQCFRTEHNYHFRYRGVTVKGSTWVQSMSRFSPLARVQSPRFAEDNIYVVGSSDLLLLHPLAAGEPGKWELHIWAFPLTVDRTVSAFCAWSNCSVILISTSFFL